MTHSKQLQHHWEVLNVSWNKSQENTHFSLSYRRDGSVCKSPHHTKTDHLSALFRMHTVERENQLLRVVSQSPFTLL